jgi:PEP-CTERM motif-containing protein
MMKPAFILLLFLFSGLLPKEARADTFTIDFENLSDSTIVGSAYASSGVIFTNAIIATAGFSLNEFEVPPNSGSNVVLDNSGPITLTFLTPVSSFSGFFTYAAPLTLDGFGSSNQLLVTASSLFSTNLVSSGNLPNELIQLNFPGGIDSVTITGVPEGGSFALDDASFTTVAPNTVPEPGSLWLLFTGIALALIVGRRK